MRFLVMVICSLHISWCQAGAVMENIDVSETLRSMVDRYLMGNETPLEFVRSIAKSVNETTLVPDRITGKPKPVSAAKEFGRYGFIPKSPYFTNSELRFPNPTYRVIRNDHLLLYVSPNVKVSRHQLEQVFGKSFNVLPEIIELVNVNNGIVFNGYKKTGHKFYGCVEADLNGSNKDPDATVLMITIKRKEKDCQKTVDHNGFVKRSVY